MSKVDQKVAFNDVKSYLEKHLKKEFRRGQMDDKTIEDEYFDLIEAVEDGLLKFDDKGKAIYKLREPLYTDKENADLVINQISTKSRIKAADKHVLMNGLNVQKQMGSYTLKVIAYITQLSERDIKELERDDFDVLNQLCSVF